LIHLIYTGLLLGYLGSALASGEWRGLVAVPLVTNTLWSRLRLEEKWMRERYGESYATYCRRVATLVPYVI
jgi:protein-S-isoprenylcysteine O-methyltransferase Ste14